MAAIMIRRNASLQSMRRDCEHSTQLHQGSQQDMYCVITEQLVRFASAWVLPSCLICLSW
eukprot:493014-Amphidinium_carterae.1